MALQAEVTSGLMASEAVLGTAVGLDEAEKPAIVVYVDRNHGGVAAAIRSVPPQLRGIALKVEVTEKFRALAAGGKPGGGGGGTPTVNHKAKQDGAIQLGTSGGWAYDLANGYCCGGTLGALISVTGGSESGQYILSNYHVFEADIVSGGNKLVATKDNPIIQPGLIDSNCNAATANVVATLRPLQALKAVNSSNFDCSIAKVVNGAVDSEGKILEIGVLSAATVAPKLNQAVKKSGRTTGLTRSKVSGLNATIRVTYENECAGGTAFTITFTGQIVITNRGSAFLNGGDSGSLLVQDITDRPGAIGLLYAGSSTSAIANPIDGVLGFVGTQLGGVATMVGQ